LSIPSFGIAADLACSETFAYGRDYYGNLGLRFGDRPWRLSLALDGAGSRFVDSAGSESGAGLRAAARLERRGKRSSLFRLGLLARGPGPEEGLGPALSAGNFASITGSFNRETADLYWRPPPSSAALGIKRLSLSLDRDGRDEEKVLDSADLGAAFKLGPVDSDSQAQITGVRQDGEYTFESFKISQGLSLTLSKSKDGGLKNGDSGTGGQKFPFQILVSAKAGYKKSAGKDGLWDASLALSARGRAYRLSFKAAAVDFPQKWEYTLSWRLQY
jgi:hypothetical protein